MPIGIAAELSPRTPVGILEIVMSQPASSPASNDTGRSWQTVRVDFEAGVA